MEIQVESLKCRELRARRTKDDELSIGLDYALAHLLLNSWVRQVESRPQVKRISFDKLILVAYLDHPLRRVDFRDVHSSEGRRPNVPVFHVGVLGLITFVADCR